MYVDFSTGRLVAYRGSITSLTRNCQLSKPGSIEAPSLHNVENNGTVLTLVVVVVVVVAGATTSTLAKIRKAGKKKSP